MVKRKKRRGERFEKGTREEQQEEEKEIGKVTKKQEGEGMRERQDREGSERGGVKEEEDEEVAKIVMDTSRGGSRAFQIFVKVDNMKASMVDVASNDKISDVVRRSVGYGKQDVYATCEGMVLRKDDALKSCGVRDGSTDRHEDAR